jgi:hypothetical protein
VPLAGVGTVEVRHTDAGKSIALVGGFVLQFMVIGAASMGDFMEE